VIVLLVALLQAPPWLDSAPHRAQLVTVSEGVQLEVLDFGGRGRPIVLLAGLGNTAHVFDDFAPKLTSIGHVFAITRRGYGASTRTESGYDVARLGEDVLAAIDALAIGKPILIGHSLGGQELSYLASSHKERIAAVIYLEAAYRYAYDVPGEFERDFSSLPAPPSTPAPAPAVASIPLPEAERRQPRGHPGAAQAILAGSRQFTKIDVPALAIFASPHDVATGDFERFDEAMTERQARAFERGVPRARVLRWRRASHYIFMAQETDVVKEITSFLTTVP
jgi:non-heme chloroperoxidase